MKTSHQLSPLSLGLSFAALLALSIVILDFSPGRVFASDRTSQPPPHEADKPKEAKVERPRFDLRYVPPDAMGVIALRPSAIFADPAMKPLARMANQGLAQLRQFLKLSKAPKLQIEDIEEMVGFIEIVPGDKKRCRDHSLMAGLTMIRTARDFDWMKLMRQIDPKTEEIQEGGQTCYRSRFPKMLKCKGLKSTFRFFMPDKRTIAFIPGKTSPHFSWGGDWKRVEHGLFAVALDNRWARGLSQEQLGDAPFPGCAALVQCAATMVAGVDWNDGIDLTAYLTGKDHAASGRIVKDINTMLAQWRVLAEEAPLDLQAEDDPKAAVLELKMYKDLIGSARIEQHGATVRVHTKAQIDLADFAKYFLMDPVDSPK